MEENDATGFSLAAGGHSIDGSIEHLGKSKQKKIDLKKKIDWFAYFDCRFLLPISILGIIPIMTVNNNNNNK